MYIRFSLVYFSAYGERLYLTGSVPELNDYDTSRAIPMVYNDSLWEVEIEINSSSNFNYSYFIINNSGCIRYEAGAIRTFKPSTSFKEYLVRDEWRAYTDEFPFFSSAFKKVFYMNSVEEKSEREIIIRVPAHNLPSGACVVMCGSDEELGCWDPDKGKSMYLSDDGFWELSLSRDRLSRIIEYKFVQSFPDGNSRKYKWEEGENRFLQIPCLKEKEAFIVTYSSLNLHAYRVRVAGTAIPLSALRSEKSCGIGDFSDLKEMIDYIHITGQNVLQILPVNDTTVTHTWKDSYPYASLSVFALHPLYINLERAGLIADKAFMKDFHSKAKRINKLKYIDYEETEKLKWSYLEKLFEQDGHTTLNSAGFKEFFHENEEWLRPYALFCSLRDKYKTSNFKEWPKHSHYDRRDTEKLTDIKLSLDRSVLIHFYVQYHLNLQLKEVHLYANSKKVILKGDLPIGVSNNSAEVWVNRDMFNCSQQAGAPPDSFSARGQNWGFPTYNWRKMEEDNFSWWKRRLQTMSAYFDSYRIDHILGFFRIWEIPVSSSEGVMGHFSPALPFTADEIRANDYPFDYQRDCMPYIKEWVLQEYFGDKKEKIKSIFLSPGGSESYEFKEEFDTQRKVEKYLGSCSDQELIQAKNGLLALGSEILFLQDEEDNSKYHPRIAAQYTKSYQALEECEKEKFNRLYDYFFYERNNHLWYENAMKKLPALISSNCMMVCGEDLGMVPACLPAVMKELSILSLEIQRMPKGQKEKFGNPAWYPYLSVCTTGTHDTSTLREWWEENREITKEYFHRYFPGSDEVPATCEPWICKGILEIHLKSPSMFAVFPLQDWLAAFENVRGENPHDERINIPSEPEHYWRYRMHLNIAELIKNKELTAEIKKMIEKSGRIIK